MFNSDDYEIGTKQIFSSRELLIAQVWLLVNKFGLGIYIQSEIGRFQTEISMIFMWEVETLSIYFQAFFREINLKTLHTQKEILFCFF